MDIGTNQPVHHDNHRTGRGTARAGKAGLAELEAAARDLRARLGADGYAVCRIKRFAQSDRDRVAVVFSSVDQAMREALAALGRAAQRHMERSLLPFIWAPAGTGTAASGFLQPLAPPPSGPAGICFPVKLGTMGNGFVVFFGPHLDVSDDRVVEFHREAIRLLRDLLRFDVDKTVPRENLNDRELQCLQLAADGHKSEAIAGELQLSVHTVNAYLGFAAGKLDAVNRIQAIAKAIRLGLIA